MDVTDLIRLVEANDLEQLRSVLENGTDPNLACQYTGMTALLSACETNNFAAVQILIDAGADPNWRHFDGYNCYDSTQNPAIKHFVIEHGFNLILSRTSESKFSRGYRLLSPAETMSEQVQLQLQEEGESFILEYKLYDYPPPSGEVVIRVEPDIRHIRLSGPTVMHEVENIRLNARTQPKLMVEIHDLKGEVRVRLYDQSVLDSELVSLVTYPWPG